MSRLRNYAPQIAALVLGASASVGSFAQTTLKFGEGAGEATIPAHYAQVEDRDASLVGLSKPEGNVKLYFDLHKLDAAAHIANPGEVMVREQAEKNGKQLSQVSWHRPIVHG